MINPSPFLSILIPTRNRAKYLPYAVQSALNLEADDIEILVSENHSADDSAKVLSTFYDPRLQILSPQKPLPMHANWEFLLSRAKGEWLYFLGDDDAIMPHAVRHLKYVSSRYPQAEAIVSPRAYYYWSGLQNKPTGHERVLSFSFSENEKWVDSKKALKSCLRSDADYVHLPQLYSGGFQKKSLVNRIRRGQCGQYFKSVSPDAYSAVAACIYTYRYLEIGVPLAWVGSSPHSECSFNENTAKDRTADFVGMHQEDDLTYCAALGRFKVITRTFVFFEAYLAALPVSDYKWMSWREIKRLFFETVLTLRINGTIDNIDDLASDLGFRVPSNFSIGLLAARIRRLIIKTRSILGEVPVKFLKATKGTSQGSEAFKSSSRSEFPDILSCDTRLLETYERWMLTRPFAKDS